MTLDLEAIRAQFPALSETDDGLARVYFDNPAGTQVPQRVVDAMAHCMLTASANLGGYFRTSEMADEIVTDAQQAMADFLNAPSADEIVFGQNMTSLTFHVSRSIGRHFRPGDEIILSRMDHDANVQPWVLMARDHGLTVRWLPFDTETFEFDLQHLERALSERTRLVCVCAASNLTGTINDVRSICRIVRDAGAWTYIDAVQSAPHMFHDTQELGCDFLVCSPYKFFGPHQGVLWGRREVLESLEPYKVRPAPESIPWNFSPGTASHEGMAGTAAAVDYFAWVGVATRTDRRLYPRVPGAGRHSQGAGAREHLRVERPQLCGRSRKIPRHLRVGRSGPCRAGALQHDERNRSPLRCPEVHPALIGRLYLQDAPDQAGATKNSIGE
jgi:cysteine desulfurase family protein (TIGR01976 family)